MSKSEIPQEVQSKYVDSAWVRKAHEITRSVEEKLSVLKRHEDLIASGVVAMIRFREMEAAKKDYMQRRLEGHANDNYSRKPGVKIYLRFEGYVGAIKVCEDAGYPIGDDQKSFVTPYMSVIELPKGVYGMGMGGAQFYQESEDNFEEGDRASRRKPFSMPYGNVVRVEGADGELWQNVDYGWDGSPKNPQ